MKKFSIIVVVLLACLWGLFNHNEQFIEAAAPQVKDIPKDVHCELCNMVVYQKKHKMGIFSAQAIGKNGEKYHYDDIGCLLYDEVKNKTKNKKYVLAYNTKKWIDAEKAIYVKSTLKSPMNWGYIYFATKKEANTYIAKNKTAKIVQLSVIKEEATKKYKKQFGTKPSVPKPTPINNLKNDVPNNTSCEFCNMVVYTKKSEFGVFSAKALKKNGKVAYYDDISCLLYAEAKNREKNEKYVRDYTTLTWTKAEKATYVKTELHSPMDDGYLYFAKALDAKKYVAKNKGTKIVPYNTVRNESIQRYQ